ncbi:TIGR03000 domain-containing protein [Rosistilla oblonga]|uniref:TIGR03000 domain-containing protein n=1 Tax=Rosistilla oblonga TaxID=2527990 RepID=UPI003A9875A9
MRRIHVIPVAIAAVAMTLTGEAAHAGWGSFGSYGSYGSHGSSGSYGSSGGYRSYGSSGASSGSYGSYSVSYSSYGSSGASYGSSGSSGGSSGHFGILKRIKARHHARHQAWRAARASSGGSSGYASSGSSGYSVSSYASSGGSYGSYRAYSSYGSSGGSSGHQSSGGSSGSYSASYYSTPVESYSTPMYESAPIYSEPAAEAAEGESIIETPVEGASYQTQSASSTSEALLTMEVPADADVYVNGTKTRSTGAHRQFVSRGLTPGYAYSYDVRIEHTVNGELVTESKVVRLHGGETRSLVYSAPAVEAPAYVAAPEAESDVVETVLTVNVPADAKVTLAGNATDADGTTRTFRTKQLQAGQVWSDYTVTVAIQRDGRTLTEEKTISLSAGSTPELTFDFADETVAMR